MNPNAHWVARQRHSHWIGGRTGKQSYGIFDVNCMNNGTGWCKKEDWINYSSLHTSGN